MPVLIAVVKDVPVLNAVVKNVPGYSLLHNYCYCVRGEAAVGPLGKLSYRRRKQAVNIWNPSLKYVAVILR